MGAFHSTKTFENLETAANGTEISWKSFQKFRKLLSYRNANHSTENFRNSGSKVEWKEKFREIFSKIWVYLERLSSFLEMSENHHYRCSEPKNAVPFATGSCRKFKPEVLVEWKAPFDFNFFQEKSAPPLNFPVSPFTFLLKQRLIKSKEHTNYSRTCIRRSPIAKRPLNTGCEENTSNTKSLS